MSRKRIVILIILVGLMVGFQAGVMDQMEEKIEEDRLSHDAKLPASSALPSFFASLFLGSFRVVAIDVFWIQLKNLRSDHRYFEAKELMELISWLQPRNPEVWAMLGWDATYNIPEGGLTDPEEKWSWIRYGFLKFHEGTLRNKHTPYLKFELGFRLWHRMSMSRQGYYDFDLIEKIRNDDEIQRKLQDLKENEPLEERLSPFRLSLKYLQAARDQVDSIPSDERFSFFITQMGLYLHPDTMDGYMRDCFYYEGMYQWLKPEPDEEEAKKWFRRAGDQARHILKRYGQRASKINEMYARMYDELPDIVDLHAKVRKREGTEEELQAARLEALDRFHDIFQKSGSIDNGYITINLLSPLKQILSRNGQKQPDMQEYNDGNDFAREMRGQTVYSGNIGPRLLDRDTYMIYISPPAFDQRTGKHKPFQALEFTLSLKSTGRVPLRARVNFVTGNELTKIEASAGKSAEFKFGAVRPGGYFITVEAAVPGNELAKDSGFTLQVTKVLKHKADYGPFPDDPHKGHDHDH